MQKNKQYLFIGFSLFFMFNIFSCNKHKKQNLSPPINNEYNKCFSFENYYDENITTDTIYEKTPLGNFLKKISISDSTYLWLCGKNNIEYIIDTFFCKGRLPLSLKSKIHYGWETHDFMGFIIPCGSSCWTNYIYSLYEKREVTALSYSALDTINMKALEIGTDSFHITNLYTLEEEKYPIKNIECLNGKFALFYIHNIKYENNIIEYHLNCGNSNQKIKQILK